MQRPNLIRDAKSDVRRRGEGREALVKAAIAEFGEHGFDGTNSNAIARRAGYAPQTFYRHFEDKLEIFIAAYAAWNEIGIANALSAKTRRDYVSALVEHHREHRIFRRSLRMLTVVEPRVMEARTRVRLQQIEVLESNLPRLASENLPAKMARLLTIERLCDAIADGEFAAAGVSEAGVFEILEQQFSSG